LRRHSAFDGRRVQEVERLRREKRVRQELEERAKQIADQARELERFGAPRAAPTEFDRYLEASVIRWPRRPPTAARSPLKSRRKPGRHPGHPGLHRATGAPGPCGHNRRSRRGGVLALRAPACTRAMPSASHRHQVTELPPITAPITEYGCQRRQFPACVRSHWRREERVSQFGPQLTALIAFLTVVCRMPAGFDCNGRASEGASVKFRQAGRSGSSGSTGRSCGTASISGTAGVDDCQ
jgi:hypothetical protein